MTISSRSSFNCDKVRDMQNMEIILTPALISKFREQSSGQNGRKVIREKEYRARMEKKKSEPVSFG
ncbi:MAG: hypothetical protein A2W01_10680 [Candidatus Solincola sediminis]|nr:MAG: hypothetical protein A2W01_10680 [Candidatus Solincola sediminis]